jgi:hypothetical protein
MPHKRLYAPPAKGHGPELRTATRWESGIEEPEFVRPLTDAEAAWLRANITGEVILPDDAAYAQARAVFNKRYRPRPVAIINVADEADVATSLSFVDKADMAFRVRGGGHDFAGYSGGPGVVIDVSRLNTIALHGAAGEVTVGGGCPQGELGAVLLAAGWHLPLGDWPSVGVGGYMQGGGYGLTSRSLGMNLDHVVEVRVMLADGRIVTANAEQNLDLWWAVRGGTGNMFGVLLSIRYRLRKIPAVSEATLVWKLDTPAGRAQAAQALLAVQQGYTAGEHAPQTNITCMALYGLDQADPDWIGPWLMLDVDHIGDEAAMNAAIAPLLALPGQISDFDYDKLNRGSTIPPLQRSSRYLTRPLAIADFQALLNYYVTTPNPLDTMYIQCMGGHLNAIPRASSAFIHREARFLAYLDAFWETAEQKQQGLVWQTGWGALLAPFWNGRCYQNFADPALDDYRAAYWGEAFPALLEAKHKFDPRQLFRFPQMVESRADDPNEPAVWPPAVVEALRRPIQLGQA